MGRAKVPMKFIEYQKSRNLTFQKRRKGLKKKALELSTLCDIDVCMIVHGPDGELQRKPETWPENDDRVQSIINRYQSVSKEEREKRKQSVSGYLTDAIKRMEEEIQRKKTENINTLFSLLHSFDAQLGSFPAEGLWDIEEKLALKMKELVERIELLRLEKNLERRENEMSPNLNLGHLQITPDDGLIHALPLSYMKSEEFSLNRMYCGGSMNNVANFQSFDAGNIVADFPLPLSNHSMCDRVSEILKKEIATFNMFHHHQDFSSFGLAMHPTPQFHPCMMMGPSSSSSSSSDQVAFPAGLPHQMQGLLPQIHHNSSNTFPGHEDFLIMSP